MPSDSQMVMKNFLRWHEQLCCIIHIKQFKGKIFCDLVNDYKKKNEQEDIKVVAESKGVEYTSQNQWKHSNSLEKQFFRKKAIMKILTLEMTLQYAKAV